MRADPRLLAGAPASPPHTAVDAILASGFHATGGGPRTLVVVAVSPPALPLIAGWTWGEAQTLAPADDLPPGFFPYAAANGPAAVDAIIILSS